MSTTIQIQLSPDSIELLQEPDSRINRNGKTLRQWLIEAYGSKLGREADQTLFAHTFHVEDDVPLLLEAVATITGRIANDLVDEWLTESVAQPQCVTSLASAEIPIRTEERVATIAEVLDLGETLFEQTVEDAKRKLGGSYPEGDKAAIACVEVFRALRHLVGIPVADLDEQVQGPRRYADHES